MDTTQIIHTLLKNRNLNSKKDIDEFFRPTKPSYIPSPFDTHKGIELIKTHINKKGKIFIVGDYDVDGICSTAILWESINSIYSNVKPFIPHRREDGYGLSDSAIDKAIEEQASLIIAVDCGITSLKSVNKAKSNGIDVLIIDHHQPLETFPEADVILHSTSTCAAGLVWFFCRDFKLIKPDHISLVSLAVVCDMIPLIGLNRSFVKYGLIELNQIKRPGLQALYKVSGIDPFVKPIGTYEIGYLIGPRLNAMGRLENALDSLRLICTTDPVKAAQLSQLLDQTNQSRQELTSNAVEHAIANIDSSNLPNLIIVSDVSYDEGVIGLVASKIVEKFHRPTIAFSFGDKTSKGSARSIPGFDLVSYLRKYSEMFVNLGGHSMAAGMTIESTKIQLIKELISNPDIDSELLVKKHKYDLDLEVSDLSLNLYTQLQDFAPFGFGNPQPTFKSLSSVLNPKKIGKQLQHLKFSISNFDAINFNFSDDLNSIQNGSQVEFIYTLDLNTWNGRSTLQLICKTLKQV